MTAYAVGMFTLSLNFLVTTYSFLGLASVFIFMSATRPSVPREGFSAQLDAKTLRSRRRGVPGWDVRLYSPNLQGLIGV